MLKLTFPKFPLLLLATFILHLALHSFWTLDSLSRTSACHSVRMEEAVDNDQHSQLLSIITELQRLIIELRGPSLKFDMDAEKKSEGMAKEDQKEIEGQDEKAQSNERHQQLEPPNIPDVKLNQPLSRLNKLKKPSSAVSTNESLPEEPGFSVPPEIIVDLKAPPRIIYTSCCWCYQNQTWPHCKTSKLSGEIEYLRKNGIEAMWMTMPCREEGNMPDLLTQHDEYFKYGAFLRAAHAQGDVIITSLDARIFNTCPGLKRCCSSAEHSNFWVEHALSGGDLAHTEGVMKLQNKSALHDVFESAGLPDRVPKVYTEKDIEEGKIDYPVFVKETRGVFGVGVYPARNASEMAKILQKHKKWKDFIVEEALIGDRPYTVHYMSRPSHTSNAAVVSFWCGVYEKEEWKSEGIFVQGAGDVNPPLKRIPCHPEDMNAFKRIIQYTDMLQNVGCVNGKDTNGPGTMKIFDWNVRMCGSLKPEVVQELMIGLNTTYNGTVGPRVEEPINWEDEFEGTSPPYVARSRS